MTDKIDPGLGAVQETLFIPLLARVREMRLPDPALRDPKAAEIVAAVDHGGAKWGVGWGGFTTVPRTLIFDWWVERFLAAHPEGTVAELGTGLNTRFERVDDGTVNWIDLDLPDTIALRRRFFEDTDRRRMLAASVLDDDWLDEVARLPGPYFFVSEGVLVYLDKDAVTRSLSRIAERFPGSDIAFDVYSRVTYGGQRVLAAGRGVDVGWKWACDDPRKLAIPGLTLTETATISRPPEGLRKRLPLHYRRLLPLADPILRRVFTLALFHAE